MAQQSAKPAPIRWLVFRDHDLLADAGSLEIFLPIDRVGPLIADATVHVMPWRNEALGVVRIPDTTEAPEGHDFIGLRHLLVQAPPAYFEAASAALQILEWDRNHRYCSRCGTATEPHPQGERARVCPACEYSQYPRIQPCVIVAISKGDHILLARAQRYNRPMYSLLAGFVEVGETLEQAVAREVFEESGLAVDQLRYFGSQSWPFPSNLMLAFQAEWAGGDIVIQEEELMDAQFFHYRQLPQIPPSGSIAHQVIMATVNELAARFG